MSYTVHQLATLADVSVRTLHYYDAIGLLKPDRVAPNGYRYYEEEELLRLQQILFFKELDIPLEEIGRILEAPDFAITEALRIHKRSLGIKAERIETLLATIDKTIAKLTNKKHMNDDELYGGFTKKEMESYQAEAKERWGHTEAYRQSAERVKKMGPDGIKNVIAKQEELLREIIAVMDKGPRSEEAQALIARHYDGLRAFYEPSLEMYRGLAEMYVGDERFRAYYRKHHPLLPEFMRDAMVAYCESKEKK